MPSESHDPDKIAARRAEMYERYIAGWTQARLAEHYGLSRMTVHRDLNKHRETIPRATREEIRQNHQDQLERIKDSLAELVEMAGTPVTAGKDGAVVFDPETCAPVRDYSLRIQAQRELRAVIEREAKMFGVDEATKVEHSGQVEVVDSVAAELQRLSDQLGIQMPIPEASSSAEPLS